MKPRPFALGPACLLHAAAAFYQSPIRWRDGSGALRPTLLGRSRRYRRGAHRCRFCGWKLVGPADFTFERGGAPRFRMAA